MEAIKANKNGKKIILIVGCMLLFLVVIAILYMSVWDRNESYRSIKITEVNGNVTYTDAKGKSYDAVENMNLESGCALATDAGSYVVLRLDDDKYVTLEEKSAMNLYAESTKENGKTKIELTDGSVLNEIQNHLTEDASYEVKTPGATMSVRGTVFEVSYNAKKGEAVLSVYDGKVALATEGSTEESLYEAGEYTQFEEKDGNIEFIVERDRITESMIAPFVLERLKAIRDSGREIIYDTEKDNDKTTAYDSDKKEHSTVLDVATSKNTGKLSIGTDGANGGKLLADSNKNSNKNNNKNNNSNTNRPGAGSQTPTDVTPVVETPSSETPSTETPTTETPSSETPSTETSSSEAPGTETPSSETPGTETQSSETPSSETPSTETPATETPATETPATETPATEEPTTETPTTDDTTGSWVKFSVPVIVDATEVYCNISGTTCTISTTSGGTGTSLTAPTEFQKYQYTVGENITPTTAEPTVSMLLSSSNTLTFDQWTIISTNTSLVLTDGMIQYWDGNNYEYYSGWKCGTTVYYPVQITSGSTSFYFNVPAGAKIYLNGDTTPKQIYNALKITAQQREKEA